jgi:hypothetical protein
VLAWRHNSLHSKRKEYIYRNKSLVTFARMFMDYF